MSAQQPSVPSLVGSPCRNAQCQPSSLQFPFHDLTTMVDRRRAQAMMASGNLNASMMAILLEIEGEVDGASRGDLGSMEDSADTILKEFDRQQPTQPPSSQTPQQSQPYPGPPGYQSHIGVGSPAHSRSSSSAAHRRRHSAGSKAFQSQSRSPSCSRSSSSSSNSGTTSSSESPSKSSKGSCGLRTKRLEGTIVAAPNQSKRLSDASSLNGKKLQGICVTGFPLRSTDTSIRDGLFHEYKKQGKVISVSVSGQGEDRIAIVTFKKCEDAAKAVDASRDKRFFGTKIHVTPHEGISECDDCELKLPDKEWDEYHHKATRTLFVGNLEKDIEAEQLRDFFKHYGEILDIDIKKQGGLTAYAFVQFDDITSVVSALRDMDGEHIGNNEIKLGFGKSMPTTCVWTDGVATTVTKKFLCRQFGRFGHVSHCVIDSERGRALIYYDSMELAQQAVNEMRGRALAGKKIQIDFASRDCQIAFFESMEMTGQLRPGDRPEEISSRGIVGCQPFTVDRPGFDTAGATFGGYDVGRGRGSFRRSHNFRQRGRAGRGAYYEGYQQENFRSRRGRHFAGNFSGQNTDVYQSTYEQELRDYGYSQRERREQTSPVGSDYRPETTATFSRSTTARQRSPSYERHDSYDERYYGDCYRDTDSQADDRESVWSQRSGGGSGGRKRDSHEKQYDDRYVVHKHLDDSTTKDAVHGFSPLGSEHSHRSSAVKYRSSHSKSPVSGRKDKDRGSRRGTSPPTPTDDDFPLAGKDNALHAGDGGVDPKEVKHKLLKITKHDNEAGLDILEQDVCNNVDVAMKGAKATGSVCRSSFDIRSQVSKPRKRPLEETDLLAKKPCVRDRTAISLKVEEYISRQKKKFEKKKPIAGDLVPRLEKTNDISDELTLLKKGDDSLQNEKLEPRLKDADMKHVPAGRGDGMEKAMTGNACSPSSKTSSEPDSFVERESVAGSDVLNLEQEKMHLLSLLEQLDETGSVSDEQGASAVALEQEVNRRLKKPRLDGVADVERHSSLSVKLRQDGAKLPPAVDSTEETSQSVTDMVVTPSDLDKHPDYSKFQPIDTTQSFRKQMEARRRVEQRDAPIAVDGGKREQKRTVCKFNPPIPLKHMECCEDEQVPASEEYASLAEVPAEFKSKKRRSVPEIDTFAKNKRSYRTRNSNALLSSGDEGDEQNEKAELAAKQEKVLEDIVTLLNEHKHRDQPGKGELKSPYSSRRESKNPPRIIPDSVVIGGSGDGKAESNVPQEPRKMPRGRRKGSPMSLPLPRFAFETCWSPRHSPKHSVKPSDLTSSPKERSPMSSSKINSPSFSPGRQHSPTVAPQKTVPSIHQPPSPALTPPPSRPTDMPIKPPSCQEPTSTEGVDPQPPVSMTQPPVNMTQPPVSVIQPPVSVTQPTVNVTQPLISVTELPVSVTQLPVSVTQPPVSVTQPLVSVTQPLVNVTQPLVSVTQPLLVDTGQLTLEQQLTTQQPEVATIAAPLPPIQQEECAAYMSQKVSRPSVECRTETDSDVEGRPSMPDEPPVQLISESAPDVLPALPQEKTGIEAHTDVSPALPQENTGIEAHTDVTSPSKTDDDTKITNHSDYSGLDKLETPPSHVSPKLDSSDTDLSELGSPNQPSLEEQIRALDEKLSLTAAAVHAVKMPDTSALSLSDYRERFRVKRRTDAPLPTTTVPLPPKPEPSDIAKSLLARNSIFDQDSKRLKQINEKYELRGGRGISVDEPVRTSRDIAGLDNEALTTPMFGAIGRQSSAPGSSMPHIMPVSHARVMAVPKSAPPASSVGDKGFSYNGRTLGSPRITAANSIVVDPLLQNATAGVVHSPQQNSGLLTSFSTSTAVPTAIKPKLSPASDSQDGKLVMNLSPVSLTGTATSVSLKPPQSPVRPSEPTRPKSILCHSSGHCVTTNNVTNTQKSASMVSTTDLVAPCLSTDVSKPKEQLTPLSVATLQKKPVKDSSESTSHSKKDAQSVPKQRNSEEQSNIDKTKNRTKDSCETTKAGQKSAKPEPSVLKGEVKNESASSAKAAGEPATKKPKLQSDKKDKRHGSVSKSSTDKDDNPVVGSNTNSSKKCVSSASSGNKPGSIVKCNKIVPKDNTKRTDDKDRSREHGKHTEKSKSHGSGLVKDKQQKSRDDSGHDIVRQDSSGKEKRHGKTKEHAEKEKDISKPDKSETQKMSGATERVNLECKESVKPTDSGDLTKVDKTDHSKFESFHSDKTEHEDRTLAECDGNIIAKDQQHKGEKSLKVDKRDSKSKDRSSDAKHSKLSDGKPSKDRTKEQHSGHDGKLKSKLNNKIVEKQKNRSGKTVESVKDNRCSKGEKDRCSKERSERDRERVKGEKGSQRDREHSGSGTIKKGCDKTSETSKEKGDRSHHKVDDEKHIASSLSEKTEKTVEKYSKTSSSKMANDKMERVTKSGRSEKTSKPSTSSSHYSTADGSGARTSSSASGASSIASGASSNMGGANTGGGDGRSKHNERRPLSTKENRSGKSKVDRDDKSKSSRDSKQDKKSSSSASTQHLEKPQKQRVRRESKSFDESRELKQLHAEFGGDNLELGYCSMYDRLKRRSNKEKQEDGDNRKLSQSDFRTSASQSDDGETSGEESEDGFELKKKNRFPDKKQQRSRKRVIDSSSDWSAEDTIGLQKKPQLKMKTLKKAKILDTDSNFSDDTSALAKHTPVKKSLTKKKQKPVMSPSSSSSESSTTSSSDESDSDVSLEETKTKKPTLSALIKEKPRPSSESMPLDRPGNKTKKREGDTSKSATARKPQRDSLLLFNFVSDESDSDVDMLGKKSSRSARKVQKLLSSGMDSDGPSDSQFTLQSKSDSLSKDRDGVSDGERKDVPNLREKEDHVQKRGQPSARPENKMLDKSKKAHNKSDLQLETALRQSDVKTSDAPKKFKPITNLAVKHDSDGNSESENKPPRKSLKKEVADYNEDSNSQSTCDIDLGKAASGDSKSEQKGKVSKHVKKAVPNKTEGGKKDKIHAKKVPDVGDSFRRVESIKSDVTEKKYNVAKHLTSHVISEKKNDGASEKKCDGAKQFTSQVSADKKDTEVDLVRDKGQKSISHDDAKKMDKVKCSLDTDSAVDAKMVGVIEKRNKSKKSRIPNTGSCEPTVASEKDMSQSDNIFEKLQNSSPTKKLPEMSFLLKVSSEKKTPEQPVEITPVKLEKSTTGQLKRFITVENRPGKVAKSPEEKLEKSPANDEITLPTRSCPAEVSQASQKVAEKDETSVVSGSGRQSCDECIVPSPVDGENSRVESKKHTSVVEEEPHPNDQPLQDSAIGEPRVTGHSDDSTKTDVCASTTDANMPSDSSTGLQRKEAQETNNDDVATNEHGMIPDLETEAAVLGILPTSDTEYGYWSGADNFDISGPVSASGSGKDTKRQSSLYATHVSDASVNQTTAQTEDDATHLGISHDIGKSISAVKPEKESFQQSQVSEELEQDNVSEQSPLQQETVHEGPQLQQETVHERPQLQQETVHERPRLQQETVHERPRLQQETVHEQPHQQNMSEQSEQLQKDTTSEQPSSQQGIMLGQSESQQENVFEQSQPQQKTKFEQSRSQHREDKPGQSQLHHETKLEKSWSKQDDIPEQSQSLQEGVLDQPLSPQVTASTSDLVESLSFLYDGHDEPKQDSFVGTEHSGKPKSRQVPGLQKKRLQRKSCISAMTEASLTVESEPSLPRPESSECLAKLSVLLSPKRASATVDDIENTQRECSEGKGSTAESADVCKDTPKTENTSKDMTVTPSVPDEHPSSGGSLGMHEDAGDPTQMNSKAGEALSQVVEKFSSRGRKITPKERDDEMTCQLKKGRGRRAAGGADSELEVTPKARRGRKTSGRFSADEEVAIELKPEELPELCTEEVDEQPLPTVESTGKSRRSPRARRSTRRVGALRDEDKEEEDKEDNIKEDMLHTDTCVEESPSKGKRLRKPKTRSSADVALSPGQARQRAVLENSTSPRRKSLETITTSPKDIAKQAVKLEKFVTVDKIKVDVAAKAKIEHDLYDFVEDDDEDNATTHISLQTHRKLFSAVDAARKSAQDDVAADLPAPGLGKTAAVVAVKEQAPEHPQLPEVTEPGAGGGQKKPALVTDVAPAAKIHQEATVPKEELSAAPEHTGDGVYEAKSVAARKQHGSAEPHMPLKLEMKHHHHDFVMKKEVPRHPEEAVDQFLQGPPETSTTIASDVWSNMDVVINEVAKGNFERGDSYDFYLKSVARCPATQDNSCYSSSNSS
ncbi:hypothetical protein LSAT2_032681 [Lamellibrachia satsuma]|nr:hypothetical protein LSAT2_032681 [Lamellibrachia satsuma]